MYPMRKTKTELSWLRVYRTTVQFQLVTELYVILTRCYPPLIFRGKNILHLVYTELSAARNIRMNYDTCRYSIQSSQYAYMYTQPARHGGKGRGLRVRRVDVIVTAVSSLHNRLSCALDLVTIYHQIFHNFN